MASTLVSIVQAATPAELAEDAVVVVKEKARGVAPRSGLAELLFDPVEGGMAGHGDVGPLEKRVISGESC